MKTVDFLIVSFNTAPDLRACLRSLHHAHPGEIGRSIDVSVLDNGSTDGTPGMVATEFPSVRLTARPDNIFYGPAMNQLVRASTAEFVVFLNPDTVLCCDIAGPMAARLRADPGVALVYPALVGTDGVAQRCAQDFPGIAVEAALRLCGHASARHLRPLWDPDAFLERAFAPAPAGRPVPMRFVWSTCAMMRRADAEALGPFDPAFPMYDTDLDLCRRMARRGDLSVYLDDLVVEHRGGASSTPEQRRLMMAEGRRRYYDRHGSRRQVLAYRTLAAAHGVSRRLSPGRLGSGRLGSGRLGSGGLPSAGRATQKAQPAGGGPVPR